MGYYIRVPYLRILQGLCMESRPDATGAVLGASVPKTSSLRARHIFHLQQVLISGVTSRVAISITHSNLVRDVYTYIFLETFL